MAEGSDDDYFGELDDLVTIPVLLSTGCLSKISKFTDG